MATETTQDAIDALRRTIELIQQGDSEGRLDNENNDGGFSLTGVKGTVG